MTIKVIIFDVDGVIFNTDVVYFNYLQKILKELGIHIDQMFYIQNDYDDCIYKLSLPKKTIAIVRQRMDECYYNDNILANVQLRDGILPMLQQLSQSVHLAIGSGEKKSQIERYLNHFSISNFFSFVGHGALVKGRKNNPAYFHTIATHYRVKPQECLHVGDNLIDQLALQAGVSVAIIPTPYSKHLSFDPRCHLLKNIKSLPLLLKRKFSR